MKVLTGLTIWKFWGVKQNESSFCGFNYMKDQATLYILKLANLLLLHALTISAVVIKDWKQSQAPLQLIKSVLNI